MPVSTTLIDDNDSPSLVYSPGSDWRREVLLVEPGDTRITRHGASNANMTVTFHFSGTGVTVVGLLDETSGEPSTSYTVDNRALRIYEPPAVQKMTRNVTFFSTSNLASGSHILQITTLNGTSPNFSACHCVHFLTALLVLRRAKNILVRTSHFNLNIDKYFNANAIKWNTLCFFHLQQFRSNSRNHAHFIQFRSNSRNHAHFILRHYPGYGLSNVIRINVTRNFVRDSGANGCLL
ncbi:hypothetical protein C8Q80DRAFT_1276228 [Daedaleopsis nitida]|nr:hypothetical protein C8Q80DRAFT_1276228 [Daedaleopsis nitida]